MSVETESDILDSEALKLFTIPKKINAVKDLLEVLALDSREFQSEIYPTVQKSFKHRGTGGRFVFNKCHLVHNSRLLNKYRENKRKLKEAKASDKELSESYGYLKIKEKGIRHICRDGLKIGNNTEYKCLGEPSLAVVLSRHPDILSPHNLQRNENGAFIAFKILRGKVKAIAESRNGLQIDPTPNFNCHVSKSANFDTFQSAAEAYNSTQLFIYEYDAEADIVEYPSFICPSFVLHYHYAGNPVIYKPVKVATLLRQDDTLEYDRAAKPNAVTETESVALLSDLSETLEVLQQMEVETVTAASVPMKKPVRRKSFKEYLQQQQENEERRKKQIEEEALKYFAEPEWMRGEDETCATSAVASDDEDVYCAGFDRFVPVESLAQPSLLAKMFCDQLAIQTAFSRLQASSGGGAEVVRKCSQLVAELAAVRPESRVVTASLAELADSFNPVTAQSLESSIFSPPDLARPAADCPVPGALVGISNGSAALPVNSDVAGSTTKESLASVSKVTGVVDIDIPESESGIVAVSAPLFSYAPPRLGSRSAARSLPLISGESNNRVARSTSTSSPTRLSSSLKRTLVSSESPFQSPAKSQRDPATSQSGPDKSLAADYEPTSLDREYASDLDRRIASVWDEGGRGFAHSPSDFDSDGSTTSGGEQAAQFELPVIEASEDEESDEDMPEQLVNKIVMGAKNLSARDNGLLKLAGNAYPCCTSQGTVDTMVYSLMFSLCRRHSLLQSCDLNHRRQVHLQEGGNLSLAISYDLVCSKMNSYERLSFYIVGSSLCLTCCASN